MLDQPWTLETLKSKTYDLWRELHKLNECYFQENPDASSNLPFVTEIQSYGELEHVETWQAAYASLKAKFLADGCLEDGQYLIEFYLLYASKKWGWRHLLPLVIAQLEMIPKAVEAIADGLRTIGVYGCEYGATAQDIEQFKEFLINGDSEKWRFFRPEPAAISS
ncbi:MAG: hypothetical protein KME45_26870 [Stenomitos rutilans HA7619-LM2]|jgi:hypothetical protein|nr:hypothetical protein [Stenomitos rutilans HA7619-LM2]